MGKERFIDKLNRKFGRIAINNLMTIIIGAMALVFVSDIMIQSTKGVSILSALIFNKTAIFSGEIWRIFTFIFLPPETRLIFIIFALYLYWLIGNSLEDNWGAFKFNLFYLCGIIGTIIAGLITGYATNSYINLSLFLAFAIVFPDFELNLFFLIPVKVKYFAVFYLILIGYMIVVSPLSDKIAIIVSLANILLFFMKDFIDRIKNLYRRIKFKRSSDIYWRNKR
ncbi:MAG: hypothetical protein IJC50_02735 [Clostridia bacterium]|nr:hypothetical protein [Clostridia bacterium]